MNGTDPTKCTDEEWRERLTPQQYDILRKRKTEQAFTGELWDNKEAGMYRCAACGAPLFTSKEKFESGTGWPSFYDMAKGAEIGTSEDRELPLKRTEVHCMKCGGHLGHVFDDGPTPTGKRYCVNSAALAFDPSKDKAE